MHPVLNASVCFLYVHVSVCVRVVCRETRLDVSALLLEV